MRDEKLQAMAAYTLALAITEQTGMTQVSYELRSVIKAMQIELGLDDGKRK
ncbi:hypothetical protein [Halobacillus sp. Marseille-Q1614]|uniref:hypothetical protein n=1 Tax=Halobacillus sp. Marseille-Q1614 TaxID=2709134 RepID=UPI00156D5BE1|nr:hypothetical protein [Halobacillus sp. Marseille-Q1614]